ncbi:hypothetical protein [Microbacterium hominis]|uniref:Uncharacterized protein n=1 Tax=Microbacterium hominis TaxID=162426 RepID=A0A7D4UFQ8_9MICO|nr:hypothetical protein [Microbacterium hominis]QKJ18609.1 hypothetical protein HQM25_03895 [Microbacterium hominis]
MPKLIALTGTIAVIAYATLAITQILVLNPLAAVPGATLDEIHAGLAAANEVISAPWVIGLLAIGPILAVVLALLSRRADMTGRAIALAYLLILAFGAPAYFVASFGPGMALADAFMISGADYAPWGGALYLVSGAALLAAVVVAIVPQRAASPLAS